MGEILLCDHFATIQVVTFRLWEMVGVEEGSGKKMQVNGPFGRFYLE